MMTVSDKVGRFVAAIGSRLTASSCPQFIQKECWLKLPAGKNEQAHATLSGSSFPVSRSPEAAEEALSAGITFDNEKT